MFLPIGENSYSGNLYIVFLIAMCLLPFSTAGGAGSNSVVITFAFPFLLLLSIFILYNFISKQERNNYPEELRLAIFCGLLQVFSIFISSLMNQNVPMAFARSIFHIFGFAIFLYVTSNSITRKNATLVYDKVSLVLIYSGCVMSAYFIGNFLLAVQQNSLDKVLLERENGGLMALPWGASNTIAACLMMPLFVAIERALRLRPFKKTGLITKKIGLTTNRAGFANNKEIDFLPKTKGLVITIFAIGISIAAILITQSRNVIITLSLGIILIGILTKNVKWILIFFTVVAAIFLVTTTLYAQDLESIFAARVGDGAGDVEGFNGRTLVWNVAIAYFYTHPLQPIGYFGMLAEVGHTAHNIFITTVIEQGIIGLGIYVLFLINNFTFCMKKMSDKYLLLGTRRTMTIYFIAMLMMLVQLQFEDSNLTAQNIIYQWVFLSLMYLHAYCDVSGPLIPGQTRSLHTF